MAMKKAIKAQEGLMPMMARGWNSTKNFQIIHSFFLTIPSNHLLEQSRTEPCFPPSRRGPLDFISAFLLTSSPPLRLPTLPSLRYSKLVDSLGLAKLASFLGFAGPENYYIASYIVRRHARKRPDRMSE